MTNSKWNFWALIMKNVIEESISSIGWVCMKAVVTGAHLQQVVPGMGHGTTTLDFY